MKRTEAEKLILKYLNDHSIYQISPIDILNLIESIGMLPPLSTSDKLPEHSKYELYHESPPLNTTKVYYRVTPENEDPFDVIEPNEVLRFYPKWEDENYE